MSAETAAALGSPGGADGRPADEAILTRILDLARWAPSGDNSQVWRFQIAGPRHLVVHGFDHSDRSMYDFQGMGSHTSLGALLESIVIAAAGLRWAARVSRRDGPPRRPCFDVRFEPDPRTQALVPADVLESRTVHRGPLGTRRLTDTEKAALQAAVGAGFSVQWQEGWRRRLRMARLQFANAGIRLSIPEAYRAHCEALEWGARFSEDRLPDKALGASPLTLRIMRWVMRDWRRTDIFNRYLAGTVWPRVEMNLIPGLACAAHFAVVAARPAQGIDDRVEAGRAMQRLWLTAARLGLQVQPEMTPLIFAAYLKAGVPFSAQPGAMDKARSVCDRMRALMGAGDFDRAVFMGRIGAGAPARARSLRLPLASLMVDPDPVQERRR